MSSHHDRERWIELWEEGPTAEAIFEPVYHVIPEAAFALIVCTVTILSLHSWTESIMLPAIILSLFGGSMILAAPAPAAYIGAFIVLISLATAFYALWRER